MVHSLRAQASSTVSDVEMAKIRLEAYELFQVAGLSEADVDALFSIANIKKAKPGEKLKEIDAVTASAYDNEVLLILQGTARVLNAGELQREIGPGDFAGEAAFLQLEVTEKLDTLSQDPVEEMFEFADKDKSGFVDAQELQQALTSVGITDITLEQASKLLAAVDENKDGAISLQEAKSAADALQSRETVP
jgi:hypothetical protein